MKIGTLVTYFTDEASEAKELSGSPKNTVAKWRSLDLRQAFWASSMRKGSIKTVLNTWCTVLTSS